MVNNEIRILGIIPARGGSKGIPLKNITPLNGKPLINYSIEASLNSGMISNTVVSSDNEAILETAQMAGANIILRPDELSADQVASEPVIKHVIDTLSKADKEYDILVLLQPTSPLRTANHVKEALELFMNSDASSLISVYEPSHSPFKSFKTDENGFLTGLIDNLKPFMRRQDLPVVYMPNGAIYITYVKSFMSSGSLFSERTIPFVMTEEMSVDVDTTGDIKKCEEILNTINS